MRPKNLQVVLVVQASENNLFTFHFVKTKLTSRLNSFQIIPWQKHI